MKQELINAIREYIPSLPNNELKYHLYESLNLLTMKEIKFIDDGNYVHRVIFEAQNCSKEMSIYNEYRKHWVHENGKSMMSFITECAYKDYQSKKLFPHLLGKAV